MVPLFKNNLFYFPFFTLAFQTEDIEINKIELKVFYYAE